MFLFARFIPKKLLVTILYLIKGSLSVADVTYSVE